MPTIESIRSQAYEDLGAVYRSDKWARDADDLHRSLPKSTTDPHLKKVRSLAIALARAESPGSAKNQPIVQQKGAVRLVFADNSAELGSLCATDDASNHPRHYGRVALVGTNFRKFSDRTGSPKSSLFNAMQDANGLFSLSESLVTNEAPLAPNELRSMIERIAKEIFDLRRTTGMLVLGTGEAADHHAASLEDAGLECDQIANGLHVLSVDPYA